MEAFKRVLISFSTRADHDENQTQHQIVKTVSQKRKWWGLKTWDRDIWVGKPETLELVFSRTLHAGSLFSLARGE